MKDHRKKVADSYFTLYFFGLTIFFVIIYASYATLRPHIRPSLHTEKQNPYIKTTIDKRELLPHETDDTYNVSSPPARVLDPAPKPKIAALSPNPILNPKFHLMPAVFRRSGPDFFYFGNIRCATASFYEALRHHPQVVAPANKDINFWVNMDERRKGVQAYHNLYFPLRNDPRVYGDGSTAAIACPGTATTLHRQYPDLKLFASFRHPVHRAYSHYQACKRDPGNAFLLPFGQEMIRQTQHLRSCEGRYATEKEKLVLCYGNTRRLCQWSKSDTTGCAHIVLLGLYPVLTREWVSVFPKSSFFWFDMHQFHEDGARILQDAFDFLGLDQPTSFADRSRWASVALNEIIDDLGVSSEEYNLGIQTLYDYYTEMNVIDDNMYITGLE